MNCVKGDFAVFIGCKNPWCKPCQLAMGQFVTCIEQGIGRNGEPLWRVDPPLDAGPIFGKANAAPDNQLNPIRGLPKTADTSTGTPIQSMDPA